MLIKKIIKSSFLIISLWAFLSIFSYYFKQIDYKRNNAEADVAIALDYPFKVGEKLKYGIYSVGLKVGELYITYFGRQEIDGVLTDMVLLESSAPGFKDKEKIYGSIDSFSPIKIERKIQLFGENINIVEEYNQNSNEVTITRMAKRKTVKKITSKNKISNVILLLYHFRYNKNKYKIKDTIKFNLPTKQLEMLVDKQTKIEVPKGNFTALFVRSIPPRFKVWFNTDEKCVPLRIQGDIGFGIMYLAFIDFEKSSTPF